jgi:hypothetical protein
MGECQLKINPHTHINPPPKRGRQDLRSAFQSLSGACDSCGTPAMKVKCNGWMVNKPSREDID